MKFWKGLALLKDQKGETTRAERAKRRSSLDKPMKRTINKPAKRKQLQKNIENVGT